MDVEQFRKSAHELVDFICDYRSNVSQFPVLSQVSPGDILKQLPERPPEDGEPWEAIMDDVSRVVMPGITHWQHPSFFAFFPCNSTFPSLLGDMLSSGLGIQGMLWMTSPACTEIEMRVMDWLGRLLSLPDAFLSTGTGGGVIHGTASEACLSCMVAARHRTVQRQLRTQPDADPVALRSKVVAYWSDQTHSSLLKAANIAGISHYRVLPTTEPLHELEPDLLRAAIAEDRAKGLLPCFVCATIGTTSTTAVDRLEPLGRICRDEDLWFHVDAAYAGAACICPEFRPLLDGVELADSFNFNPHKWLLTSFDCSVLFVADRRPLVDALTVTPVYLRNAASDAGAVVDYRDWQVPLGRRFRSLKLWFVMRTYGVRGMQEHIRRGVAQAVEFESWVRADARFELTHPRTLSLVCFRLRPLPADDTDAANRRNKALIDALNGSGEIMMTYTVVAGRGVLRMALGGTETKPEHVSKGWALIQEQAGRLLSS